MPIGNLPDHAFMSGGPKSRGSNMAVADDVPARFESFTLAEGEKYIEEVTDTRVPNASIFTVNKEDHTMGNMITSRLARTPGILFAGYRVPHPLFSNFELRIQTDGEKTPREAFVNAMTSLVQDLATVSREFTKEVELRKMANDNPGEGAGN